LKVHEHRGVLGQHLGRETAVADAVARPGLVGAGHPAVRVDLDLFHAALPDIVEEVAIDDRSTPRRALVEQVEDEDHHHEDGGPQEEVLERCVHASERGLTCGDNGPEARRIP